MKTILVAGGAGYIGSHCVVDLVRNGFKVVVLDNLSEGYHQAVMSPHFEQCDLSDKAALDLVFKKYQIDAVVHFAAFINVGESVTDPAKYYSNNVVNTINLLDTMVANGVKNIVFSSTCAVYGEPLYMPLDENHSRNPINPYGKTKLIIEYTLEDYSTAYGLNYAALRYFNAAGASSQEKIGESHAVETHLIPLVLKTITGARANIKVFGTDYDTPDGTCIRDYIHVDDLASAHRLAIMKIVNNGGNYKVNLGTGVGHSVMEIIRSCERVTGKKVPLVMADRRAGDPARLVASNDYAKATLGWVPKHTDIDDIIKTAWNWEQNKIF